MLQEKRKELDNIIMQMDKQGASKEEILSVVNDYKSKYSDPVKTNIETPTEISNGFSEKMDKSLLTAAPRGAIGFIKEAAKTLVGASDIGNKILGSVFKDKTGTFKTAGEMIPEGALDPKSTAEEVGAGIEKVAEFLFVPDPFKAAKGAKILPKLLAYAGNVASDVAQAGIQSKLKGEGDPLQNMLGAGLASSAARPILGVVSGVIQKFQPSVKGSFDKLVAGLKPPKASMKGGFDNALENAMYFLQDEPTLADVKNMDDFMDIIKNKKKQVWDIVEANKKEGQNLVISGNGLRNKLTEYVENGPMSARLNTIDSTKKASLIDTIDQYSTIKNNIGEITEYKDLTLKEADELLMSLNAELKDFYNKEMTDAVAVLKYDPITAMKVKTAEYLRDEIDNVLASNGITNRFKGLKNAWGSLTEVQSALDDAIIRERKKSPYGLTEYINLPEAIRRGTEALSEGDFKTAATSALQPMASKVLKKLASPDYLIADGIHEFLKVSNPTIFMKGLVESSKDFEDFADLISKMTDSERTMFEKFFGKTNIKPREIEEVFNTFKNTNKNVPQSQLLGGESIGNLQDKTKIEK